MIRRIIPHAFVRSDNPQTPKDMRLWGVGVIVVVVRSWAPPFGVCVCLLAIAIASGSNKKCNISTRELINNMSTHSRVRL